jgi:hypothetical protein
MGMRTMVGKADYRTGAADRETTTPARVSSALVIPARSDLRDCTRSRWTVETPRSSGKCWIT